MLKLSQHDLQFAAAICSVVTKLAEKLFFPFDFIRFLEISSFFEYFNSTNFEKMLLCPGKHGGRRRSNCSFGREKRAHVTSIRRDAYEKSI